MNNFTFSYPTKQYFGQGSAKTAIGSEMHKYGKNVMLAYGGGSIKKSRIYDEILALLKENKKQIFEFSGIMPNPTYKKVQEGAEFARKNKIDFILAVGGGSVIDCCKIISSQACTEEDIMEMCITGYGIMDNSIRQPVMHIPTMPTTTESLTYLYLIIMCILTIDNSLRKNYNLFKY